MCARRGTVVLALSLLLLAAGALADGDLTPLRLAVEDLTAAFGDAYPNGERYLSLLRGEPKAFQATAREALLANPLLDFEELILVKRGADNLGLPANYHGNSDLPPAGYDNEIAVLGPDGEVRTLYRPANGEFVGDVDLDFDAGKLLFSMPVHNGRWQIHELDIDGANLRQMRLIEEPDVDNYDACYLPDGNLVFSSTAPFIGVPCVTGSSHVTNLYHHNAATGAIRRLTFDQDHNWCPTVLNNGRVLYLRWEYSDIPHYVARILFHMNPDGTSQAEYYGSNSYWPNAMFYARPVPDHPTKVVAVIGGHHDVPRMGELVLFDPARGRHEADGVVQRIPGRGKQVEPIILDGLVGASWPKFLHPYPLSSKYFLVSCKPTPDSKWGIYLVDVFDNMTLIKEVAGYALFEPIPLRKTVRPPVIPDRTEPDCKDAVVHLADVYTGDGLSGVPRGSVKQLRLFTYHFAYHGMGGQINRVGLDGPWDIKRVLGTVPVEADGSAFFRVPANVPISVQPLDAEGKALQLMRSWMTAMPGETLSCVGCHEKQNTVVPAKQTLATRRGPSEISPWYGPTRGFSFEREVQPVLDAYCVRCHGGETEAAPDFSRRPAIHPPAPHEAYANGTKFAPAYLELRRFVRSHTIESDMHLLTPGEFHADTTELVQNLRQGHHGVRLDAESWDRLITWIDLNTPAHGTWTEIVGARKVDHQRDRRRALLRKYANYDEDPEEIAPAPALKLEAEDMRLAEHPVPEPNTAGVPPVFEPAPRSPATRDIDLGGGVGLRLVNVPEASLWMGAHEITNEQFARFDPSHDSRLEHGDFLQFSVEERGYPGDGAKQPVVRVSWEEAMGFCAWLSKHSGESFTLPTDAQWDYACRAGMPTPPHFGAETDFVAYANLADASLATVSNYDPWKLPYGAIHPWRPAAGHVNDGYRVAAPVGSYAANPWGLHDMLGNVWEWTRSPAPAPDGESKEALLNAPASPGSKIVRGASWYDRPARAGSGYRLAYRSYHRVFNVGFRVVSGNTIARAIRR